MFDMTRGEANNNPLNINYLDHNAFNGQLGLEVVREGHSYTPRFGRYDTSTSGIRAGAKLLVKYFKVYGLTNIEGLVGRWAPSFENATSSYINDVSKWTNYAPFEYLNLLDLDTLIKIVSAFIRQENGRCNYNQDIIREACISALK